MPDQTLPELSRRTFLSAGVGTAAVVMATGLTTAPAAAADPLTLVHRGEARSIVVLDPGADAQTRSAADELIRLVQRATGVTLPLHTGVDGLPQGPVRIYVGFAGPGSHPDIATTLSEMDPDGTLLARHEATFTLIGPTSWGTRHAVQQFAERHMGVAWLMPTELGEDVPHLTRIRAPRALEREDPTFTSRTLYPTPSYQQTSWSEPNTALKAWGDKGRTHWRLHFHHNLYTIFDSKKFGTTHPEWYPIINGETYIPPAGHHVGWQPRFLAPGTVEEAAATVVRYFTTFPDAPSYSLGVTDGSGFSEDELAGTGTNSLGMPDMSPIYWNWVNQVAELVMSEHPEFSDRWIGALAYHYVQDPPPFALHPRVVPFLTYDRYHWVDPELREKDLATTRAWLEVASQLGWYDYIYGHPYAVPRVPMHLWDEVLDWARDNRIVGIMAELQHSWGEGAKPWALSRKLWDGDRSLVTESQEWYRRAVGVPAARYLQQFYELWEDFWMTRAPQTTWFAGGRDLTWFPFDDLSYLDAVTPDDIRRSRTMIENMRAHTQTPEQHRRGDALVKEFEYYEASALSYPRDLPAPTTSAEALAMINDLAATIDRSVAMAVRRKQVFEEMQADELHKKPGAHFEAYGAAWSGWNTKTMIKIADFVRSGAEGADVVLARVTELADNSGGSAHLQAWSKHCLHMINGERVSYGINTGFETGDTTGWVFKPSSPLDRPIEVTDEYSAEGAHSLRVPSGFVTCQINQANNTFPVVDGVWVQEYRYRVPDGQRATGVFVPGLRAFDAAGQALGYRQDHYVPMSASQGNWAVARYSERLPTGAVTVSPGCVAAYYGGPGEIHIDDVRFELYAAPGSVQVVEQERFFVWHTGTAHVDDPLAQDGRAVQMEGFKRTQAVHLNLNQLPTEGEWRVHVLVRLDVTAEADPNAVGIELGSYPKEGTELQTFPIKQFTDGQYHLLCYDGTYSWDRDRYLHVSGRSAGVPWVYVDRMYLTRA
ncbi:DUF4838 domain-containing protein [Propionibacteriaceae bacterium Y2011]